MCLISGTHIVVTSFLFRLPFLSHWQASNRKAKSHSEDNYLPDGIWTKLGREGAQLPSPSGSTVDCCFLEDLIFNAHVLWTHRGRPTWHRGIDVNVFIVVHEPGDCFQCNQEICKIWIPAKDTTRSVVACGSALRWHLQLFFRTPCWRLS